MRIVSIILSLIALIRPCIRDERKLVALTFDDGPHPEYTAKILKILYENDVRATFFVVGSNAERYPGLVRAEYDLGNEIGNHTYSHRVCVKDSDRMISDEIKNADKIISDITGEVPTLFRPPEGKIGGMSHDLYKSLGKRIILWDVDTRDWAHTPVDKIVKNVKENVRNGSVILFHDFVKPPSPTPESLGIIIPYLRENGYEFVTVSELLEDVAESGVRPSFFIG